MSVTTVIEPGTALNHAWGEAFNAGDLPRLLEFYEPDAVIVPGPGADPVRGLPAIEGTLRWFLGLGGRLTFGEARYWIVSGDVALGSIAFVLEGGHDADGRPVPLAGTTSEVVRRQPDGTWRYVVDHPFGG
jgi:ketosteroid isomerase-like protein